MTDTTWSFQPGTGLLVRTDGKREFTMAEFLRQLWPPCPSCGGQLDVEPVRAGGLAGMDNYMPSYMRCLAGCNHRR